MIAEMPRGFSTSRILLYGWVSTANRIFADSEFMPFLVKNAMFDLQFYVDNTRSKGNFELLGGLETERLPVSHQHNVLRVYMEEQKLELRLDATETIAEFGSALLASNATQVLLVDGIATATVGSPFGELRIDNVPLSVPLEVRGIALSGGMSQSEMMTVSSFSLRDYKAGVVGPPRLLLEASLSIDAPLNVSLTFDPVPLELNESGPAFNEVTSAVLGGSDGGPLTLEIEGTASVSILMALGEMRLAGLEVNMDVHVEPLGELFLKRLHVDTLSPFAGNSSGLYFQHDVQIRLSPEESEGLLFGARLGPLSLQLMMPVDDPTEYIEALFQSQTDGAWFVRIGVLEMEGLVIDPAAVRGGHAVEIRVGIVIDPPKVDSGGRLLAVGPRQLISNFAGGRSTQVVAMSGSRPASSHPLVERALRTWRAEVTVPGASEKFLVDTLLDISGGIFLGVSLRVSLVVKNPLELPVSLFFIDFKIIASSNGEAIAAEKIDWLESPEVIPPGETVTTREFSVEVAVGAAVGSIVQAMWGRSGARLDFRAVGLLMLSIGEYRMVMDIDQSITQA
eukprot:Polyplicarium_translucidae@DN3167_c0_g2_i2.p1